jgi:peptide/nickel transport system substrate-binding protein
MNRIRMASMVCCALVLAACGGSASVETTLGSGADTPPETTASTTGSGSTETTAAPAEEPAEAPLVRVGLQFNPDSGWAIDTDDAFVLTNMGVTETLVRVDDEGVVEPGLAESWEQVDETTWQFSLAQGVVFHDGATLDAEAVAGALNWLFAAPAPPRGLTDGVEAAVVDPATVQVTTPSPDPLLPLRMASPNTAILSPAAYATNPPSPFGTGSGPFVFADEQPGQSAMLEPFADHRDGAPTVMVEVRFIPDSETRATALRTGELHIAEGVPSTQVALLEGDGIVITTLPTRRTTSIYPNTSRPPFDDPAARAALAAAIDRVAIAQGPLEGAFPAAGGLFTPADPWALGTEPGPSDPEAARTALAEAGLEGDELSVAIATYTDRAELPVIATALQAMLNEAGFDASVEVSEYAALEPSVLEGDFDLFVLARGYTVDVNDPGGMLESDVACDGSYNLARICVEEIDAAIAELRSLSDPTSRNEQIRSIEELLLSGNYLIPLFHGQAIVGSAPGVTGFEVHPLGHRLITASLTVEEG